MRFGQNPNRRSKNRRLKASPFAARAMWSLLGAQQHAQARFPEFQSVRFGLFRKPPDARKRLRSRVFEDGSRTGLNRRLHLSQRGYLLRSSTTWALVLGSQ